MMRACERLALWRKSVFVCGLVLVLHGMTGHCNVLCIERGSRDRVNGGIGEYQAKEGEVLIYVSR
jgi:hypothetical protein